MKVQFIAGLGFGDEGKGTITDAMVRNWTGAKLVVRYNGGPQAAHNVVTDDGKHHAFSQFGSGTLAGARTHLSRFMAVDPGAFMREAMHLEHLGIRNPCEMVSIDPRALVVTVYHRLANRIREKARGAGRHGSCGMGHGECVSDSLARPDEAIRVGDLGGKKEKLLEKLDNIRWHKLNEFTGRVDRSVAPGEFSLLDDSRLLQQTADTFDNFWHCGVARRSDDHLPDLIEMANGAVFEGAQGVLLDEWHGFHPYTTWSTCTFENAYKLLDGTDFEVERIGVLRTMHTRHGAGPLPTESRQALELTGGDHNVPTEWQGTLRAGWFDCVLARYAIDVVGGVDHLAMTYVDRIPTEARLCNSYGRTDTIDVNHDKDLRDQEKLGRFLDRCEPTLIRTNADQFLGTLEECIGQKISVVSRGPRPRDKDLRCHLR